MNGFGGTLALSPVAPASPAEPWPTTWFATPRSHQSTGFIKG